jgi:hypothetical protein
MTKHQAFLLDALIGVPACLAGVWLLDRLGVGENVLLVAAMLTIVIPAFGVALISRHYELKRIEKEGHDGDGGDPRAG